MSGAEETRDAGRQFETFDSRDTRLRAFFFPRLTGWFFCRVALLALLVFCVCRFVVMPCYVRGRSMEPTVSRTGFALCDRLYRCRGDFRVGDIVVIRYAGNAYLLKRIVALPGDTVEFRHGTLFRNGTPVSEPYVRFRGDWDLKMRTVAPGKVYVIGDNRGMSMREHVFGAVDISRIAGRYLR